MRTGRGGSDLKRVWRDARHAVAIVAGVSALEAVTRRLPGARALTAPADAPRTRRMRDAQQIFMSVLTRIGDDRVLAEAASVTYYTLLAIFPALAALISLYGLVADPSMIIKDLDGMRGVVPEGGIDIIRDQVRSLTSSPNHALGLGAVAGLLISIWSANAGVKSLFDALNAVYAARETRSYLHRTWLSLVFTLGALVFVILALSAVVVVPTLLNFIGLQTAGARLLALGSWPVMLAAIMLFLALTYRFGPCRAEATWRWVTWGSALAALVWIAASAGFSWYVANFGSYNKTYGSLGAAAGFMTWIWISTIIVLVGAELDAELERRRPK